MPDSIRATILKSCDCEKVLAKLTIRVRRARALMMGPAVLPNRAARNERAIDTRERYKFLAAAEAATATVCVTAQYNIPASFIGLGCAKQAWSGCSLGRLGYRQVRTRHEYMKY